MSVINDTMTKYNHNPPRKISYKIHGYGNVGWLEWDSISVSARVGRMFFFSYLWIIYWFIGSLIIE